MHKKGLLALLAGGIGASAFFGWQLPSTPASGSHSASSIDAPAPATPSAVAAPAAHPNPSSSSALAVTGSNAPLAPAQPAGQLDTAAAIVGARPQLTPPSAVATVATGKTETERVADLYQGREPQAAGEQIFIKPAGTASFPVTDAATAKALITDRGRGYFQLGPQDDIELKTAKRDDLGNDFYKFQQTYAGLPVAGRELVVQTDPDRQLAALAGQFQPGIQIGTMPGITAARALDTAMTSLEPVQPPNVIAPPELTVYVNASNQASLTYRAIVEFQGKRLGYRVDELYIDAHTGRIVTAVPRLHSALGRELFDLKKQCIYSSSQLPGQSLPANTQDAHAKAAYDNTGLSYWFYKNLLNRDSYDAKGINIRSTVHAYFSTGSSCTGDNAMFSANLNQLIFGEGGTGLSNPAGALDIVAHELTHGVTARESNLTYQGESGAINEALSDIFGAAAETWVASGGSMAGNPASLNPTTTNWTIGEKSASGNSFKRYMYDPAADGQSKDYYPNRYTGTQDSGGVHLNSGIMNLAFYLLSQGGRHPRQSNGVQVSGIGMKKALDIYYHAATHLFTSSTNFQQARNLLAQSAQTLFGQCSAEWEAVHKSYDAVAAPGTWQTCGSGGATPAPAPAPVPAPAPSPSNLATGAVAVASSVYPGYTAGNANDGKTATAWNSRPIGSPYAQEWVRLDLRSAKSLKSASIKWSANGNIQRFQVLAYQAGAWRVLADQVANSGTTSTISLPSPTAQYVVVTMMYGQLGRRYGIDEISLY